MASQPHQFHHGGEPSSHGYPSYHHTPFGSAPGCDTHGPSHIVAQLQQHIARLETELAHERSQRAVAQHANTYIVENLVRTLQSGGPASDDSDVRKELTLAKRQNQALKAQLSIARQDARKAKAKARLLLTHAAVPKFQYESSAVTGSTRSSIPQAVHADVGALINLLEDNDHNDNLYLETPSLTPEEGSPSHHRNISFSSNDSHVMASTHTDRSEVVTVTGLSLTGAKTPAQTPSRIHRPNYVRYTFEPEDGGITSSKVVAQTVVETHEAVHKAPQAPRACEQLGDDPRVPISQSNAQHHATETDTSTQPGLSGLPGLGASSWATEKGRPTNPALGQSRWSQGESLRHSAPNGSSASSAFKVNVPPDHHGPFPTKDIYDSPDECRRAIFINQQAAGPQDLRFPDLFRFGLFYKPDPEDRNVFRTVIIDNLPSETTLAEVMEHVRGGPVQSARLLDTKNITGHMTAMVVFLHERSASAFAAYASTNPPTFDGEQARVTHLRTPTWPLNQSRSHAVSQLGQTRCLLVRGVPDTLSYTQFRAQLQASSELKCDLVQSLKKLPDGSVQIVFEDVFAAGSAYGKLTTFHIFRSCRVAFARDPCDQPVHTLDGKSNVGQHSGVRTCGSDGASLQTPLLDYGDDTADGGLSKQTSRSRQQDFTTVTPSGDLEHQVVDGEQAKLVDVATASENGSVESDHSEHPSVQLEDEIAPTTGVDDGKPFMSPPSESGHQVTPLLNTGGSTLRRLKSYDSLDTVVEGPSTFNSVNGRPVSGASVLVH